MTTAVLGTPNPAALARYRETLPTFECAALEAWLSQFYNYQLEWILEPSKRAACNKGRQIGLSHGSAGGGVIWGAFHGELTTIVSKGELEAFEVLDKAQRHCDVLSALGSRMAKARKSGNTLYFPSGGRLMALPSSGGRSFTGNLILDEFAYQQHAKQTWDAAVPAMRLGDFKLRIISTPNGVGNEFHNIVESIQAGTLKGYKLHEIPIERAQADGFPVDLAECWADAKGDPRIFDQMYRCKFLDSDMQYIPSDLLRAALLEGDAPSDGVNYGGLDIGETRDRTVLVILRRVKEHRYLVHIESHNHTDDKLIDELVQKAFGVYNCARFAADATGIGSFPAKRLKKRYGRRFEPVLFGLTTKEDLATNLYDVLSAGELHILESYIDGSGEDQVPLLRDDVHAIRRIVTPAGNVRYDAQRTSKGHADRAWALMLANHAAGTMSRMYAALQ